MNIKFTNPLAISTNNGVPDKIRLQLAPKTFFSKDTGQELTGEVEIDIPVPKQFPSEEEKAVTEGVAGGVKTLMAANLIVTFVIQFFFSQVLKNMWPLYNMVQLLCILIVVDIQTPTNATLVLTEIQNAINLNALPKDLWYVWIEDIVDNNPWLADLIKAGGVMSVFALPGLLILLITLFTVYYCKSRSLKCYNLYTSLINMLFWSMPLRTVLLTYIPMCLAAHYGNIFQIDHFDGMNIALCIYLCLCIAGSYGFVTYHEAICLEHSHFKEKWGTLYQGLKTKYVWTMLNPVVFFARRLLYVMALQVHIFPMKYMGITFVVMMQLCYLVNAMPYESKIHNTLEIVNEIFLLCCVYMLPCFTDWIPTKEA